MSATRYGAGRSRDVVAPRKLSSASSRPEMMSGSTPKRFRMPVKNSSRLLTSRAAEVATKRTREAPAARISATKSSEAANTRSRAWGAKAPVASTPCPRRTIVIRRSTSRSSPSTRSAMSSRIELVPQSTAATRTPSTGGTPSDTRASAAPVVQRLQRLVAQGVHAWAGGQRVADQHVQTLDAGRHATGSDAGDLLDVFDGLAVREIGLVRGPVARSQVRIRCQTVRHFLHHALGLQRPDGRGEPRTRHVVRRGERRTVGQPRLRLDHVGEATRAAVSNRADPARGTAELFADCLLIGRTDAHRVASGDGVRIGSGVGLAAPGVAAGAGGCPAPSTLPHSFVYQVGFCASVVPSAGDDGSGGAPTGLPSAPITRYPTSPGITQPSRCRACALTYASSPQRAISSF